MKVKTNMVEMSKIKKKGVSPIVATILLISIVVILALIIFLWARSFVGEKAQKFNSAIDYSCGGEDGVKMEAGFYTQGQTYSLDVKNNGNVPIYGFVVKEFGKGTVISKDISNSGTLNLGESMTIQLDNIDVQNINELLVIPILLGQVGDQREAYTCGDEFGYLVSTQSL